MINLFNKNNKTSIFLYNMFQTILIIIIILIIRNKSVGLDIYIDFITNNSNIFETILTNLDSILDIVDFLQEVFKYYLTPQIIHCDSIEIWKLSHNPDYVKNMMCDPLWSKIVPSNVGISWLNVYPSDLDTLKLNYFSKFNYTK
jgi:hypothetical protein